MFKKLWLSLRLVSVFGIAILVGTAVSMLVFPFVNAVKVLKQLLAQLRSIWAIQPLEQKGTPHA